MQLEEVLYNLNDVVKRYQNVPLIEVFSLSEILRDLGCNLSYLVTLRKHYYNEFQSYIHMSSESTQAGKTRFAENKVPELDEIRKILKHYSDLQSDIRSQISLYKNER